MPQPSPRPAPARSPGPSPPAPAGLTLNSSTGAITGTPTAAGTANFTVQVAGAGGSTASKALAIVIAALPSMENWTQGTHDAGILAGRPVRRSSPPPKRRRSTRNGRPPKGPRSSMAASSTPLQKPPTAPETLTLLVYDLAGGTIASSRALTSTECSTATEIATTATQVIANCGNNLMAFGKAAPRDPVADRRHRPGRTLQTVSITGTMGRRPAAGGAVLAYRLSDGTRMAGPPVRGG